MPVAPDSASVGVSGNRLARVAAVTATACNLPVLTCGKTEPSDSKATSTWPPIKSVSAGAAPLYAVFTKLIFMAFLYCSPSKSPNVPAPAVAQRKPSVVLPLAIMSAGVRIVEVVALTIAPGVIVK